MKKSLLILVALFTMILIPWNVEAGLKALINEGDYKCETTTDTKLKKKKTTCVIAFQNTGTTDFAGGTLTLKFTPKDSSTTWSFELGTAKENSAAKTKNSVELHVDPIAAGKTVEVGTVTWLADNSLTEADCGGDITPDWKSASSDETGSEDDLVTDTGYAIPYVALAIGAVGVITVLATSKKKTKMYKI